MVSFLDNWPEGPEDAATPPPGKDDGKKGRHGGARAVFTPETGEQRAPSSRRVPWSELPPERRAQIDRGFLGLVGVTHDEWRAGTEHLGINDLYDVEDPYPPSPPPRETWLDRNILGVVVACVIATIAAIAGVVAWLVPSASFDRSLAGVALLFAGIASIRGAAARGEAQ